MRILSLDLGMSTLGICISDKLNKIAIPLENFRFEYQNWELPLKKIINLTNEYEINKILLGHPLKTDGTKSDTTIMAENFFKLLKNNLKVDVKLVDERFSTKRGIELLKNKYKNKEDIQKNKDLAAAYVMLVDYLMYNN